MEDQRPYAFDQSAELVDRFKELIEQSERILFFTGAGISTESGIPDYRSPGTGIWTKTQPIYFDEFLASEEKRTESWRRKFTGDRRMETAKPNNGHKAIAKLVREDKVERVVTQNVDNLHQASGVPDALIVELHGNAHYAACLGCETRYELVELAAQFEANGRVKACSNCGGIIKTATISFGQSLPEEAMHRAHVATYDCDLFVVVGSSLSVYPANAFPELAKNRGKTLVVLNRDETPLDPMADLVLRMEIGVTMSYVTELN